MKNSISIVLILFAVQLLGQNTIVKSNGERIDCKILEVSPDLIKFTKTLIPESPTFSLSINDVDTVHYTDSYFETFIHNKKNSIPLLPNQFLDLRDSTIYPLITIGSQTWFASNLKFDTIGSLVYNRYTDVNKYGRLYNFETANTACPCGWHLPSDEEWKTLERELGMIDYINQSGWRGNSPGQGYMLKVGGSSGFEAIMAGKYENGQGHYINVSTFFWTSSQNTPNFGGAWTRQLNDRASIRREFILENVMYSVRCIKDES